MSDVAALENLVLKNKQLKSEIGKVIIVRNKLLTDYFFLFMLGGIVC